jgi:hypothetical protein
MPEKHATLEEVDGRPALRFERALPHPPERVWKALTAEYQGRFGISPEEATPPPARD